MVNKKEVWMRILVFIISGAILDIWGSFILILALVQFVLMLSRDRKEKGFVAMSSEFSEQIHCFMRYITFVSEEKPFPFSDKKRKR